MLGAQVPGHHQEQLKQTLIVHLKKHYFTPNSLILKSQENRMDLVTRPGLWQQPDDHQLRDLIGHRWQSPGGNCPRVAQPVHVQGKEASFNVLLY